MATQTNALTNKILKFLFENGCFCWRQNTAGRFDPKLGIYRSSRKVGVPDIVGCTPTGRLLTLEIKVGKDKLRPEQVGFIESVRHCQGIALVITSWEDFLVQFKEIVL